MASQTAYTAKIPVTFYPPGNLGHVEKDVEGVFELPTSEIALVLVDTWNGSDPEEGQEPSQNTKNIQMCLHECRTHGITVIHAPNHPVVDKYPQYHAIKKTVQDLLKNEPSEASTPSFLDWPPKNNNIYAQARKMRSDALADAATHKVKARDISRFLLPLEDEYVLATHNEFRYVLWKHKIKLLLYVGGALNECMQHRDTGLNLLAGVDSRATGFTLVVLKDCSSAKPTPGLGSQDMAHAMLEYFKCKITFVGNSKEIAFT